MLEKLKDLMKVGAEKGLYFPFAYDGTSGKPSVTLFFTYVAFYLTIISLIVLHFRADPLASSVLSVVFWVLTIVFYLIRRLTKFKVDLDDKQIELEGDTKNEESNK